MISSRPVDSRTAGWSRPDFSVSVSTGEGLADRGGIGIAGHGCEKESPGFDRVEKSSRDEAAGNEVTFGTGETVGGAEDRAGPGAGGQDDRFHRGKLGQRLYQAGGHTPDAHSCQHQPIDVQCHGAQDRIEHCGLDRNTLRVCSFHRHVPRAGNPIEVVRMPFHEVAERPAVR